MAAKIKKGDRVVVLTGKDKGRQGAVLKVFPKEERVLVEGLNMVQRHTRPSQGDPQGGRRTIREVLGGDDLRSFLLDDRAHPGCVSEIVDDVRPAGPHRALQQTERRRARVRRLRRTKQHASDAGVVVELGIQSQRSAHRLERATEVAALGP